MRATFDLKPLRDAFKVASRCVASRSPKPELACVRLECNADGTAVLAGTNLESSASARVHGVNIDDPGVVLIDAQRLGKILQAADPSFPVDVERIGDGPVRIESGDDTWELGAFDPDRYPAVPGFPEGPTLTIDAHLLHKAVRRTIHAADDTDSSAWTFTACRLSMDGDMAVLSANDRNSFAVQRVPATGSLPESPPLLPAAFLSKQLLAAIDPDGPAVDVAFESSRWAAFRQGDVALTTRLAEGRFREPDRVLAAERKYAARLFAGDLRSALKRAAVTVSETSRALILDFSPGWLAITSVAEGVGKSVARIKAESDESFRLALDSDCLSPVLATFGDEDVLDCKLDPTAPALLRADGLDYLVAVMDVATVLATTATTRKKGAA